jgi:hypothetical protein
MCTQGGGASTEKICQFSDPFLPEQYVINCVELKEENVPADKAEVPFSLSSVWMNVVCSSLENHADVSCVFHIMTCVHGLCKGLNNNAGEVVRMYLTVCIAKCLGLLIGHVRVDRVVVFGIGGVRLCCIVFLMNRGSMAWAARFASCHIAQFVLEVHDIVGINCLGGWVRSTSRAPCGRRHLGDEGVEHCHNRALGCRGSHC